MGKILLLLITFIAYNVIIITMFGVPPSLSKTYYLLEERNKGGGGLFTLFCVAMGLSLLPTWLDLTPSTYQFIPFLSCAGLIFVGVAAQFNNTFTAKVHYSAAIICCVSSQVWCICLGYIWVSLVLFLFVMGYALWQDRAKWMYWVEIAAFTATFTSLFLELK